MVKNIINLYSVNFRLSEASIERTECYTLEIERYDGKCGPFIKK